MVKLFQSGWVAALVGTLTYLGVTAVLINPSKLAISSAPAGPVQAVRFTGASWDFFDPEVDQLISELAEKKEAMDQRQVQLLELESRLLAERAELNQVTQAVHQLRMELARNVIQLEEEEANNLKKLGKTYEAMTPDVAASILEELDDDQIVKILFFIKDAGTGAILEGMAKRGDAQTKRVAKLSEQLRTFVANMKAGKK